MTRYKVTNIMKDKYNLPIRIETVFTTFENVIDKITRDLQSIWRKTIPLPETFIIEEVSDDTEVGIKVYDSNNELMTENEHDVEEAVEVLNSIFQGDDAYKDADKIAMDVFRKTM